MEMPPEKDMSLETEYLKLELEFRKIDPKVNPYRALAIFSRLEKVHVLRDEPGESMNRKISVYLAVAYYAQKKAEDATWWIVAWYWNHQAYRYGRVAYGCVQEIIAHQKKETLPVKTLLLIIETLIFVGQVSWALSFFVYGSEHKKFNEKITAHFVAVFESLQKGDSS